MGVIYCLEFPNGKKYIGQTIQPLNLRLKQHKIQSYCKAVHNAIIKYNDFKCNILIEVQDDELDFYEEHFITLYNTLVPNGYNIRSGGKKSKFCEETKQKMSSSHKGKTHSLDTKNAISKALTGRKLDDEVKYKISITKKNMILSDDSKMKMSRLGMKHTDDAKNKVSAFNKGKYVSKETCKKLSQSLRKIGKDLPIYIHRREEKTYHGSGYIVRIPGLKSKSFISKKLSDEEKYKLALEYYNNNIQYEIRSTTKQ